MKQLEFDMLKYSLYTKDVLKLRKVDQLNDGTHLNVSSKFAIE